MNILRLRISLGVKPLEFRLGFGVSTNGKYGVITMIHSPTFPEPPASSKGCAPVYTGA